MNIFQKKQAIENRESNRRKAVMELLARKDEYGTVTVTVTYAPAYASLFDRIIHVFDGPPATEQ